jgi:C1A family cysteine protease
MKSSKQYMAFAMVLCLVFFAKVNTWNDTYADVEAFRGAQLEDAVFYPLKAKSINEEGLMRLYVGSTSYDKADGLWMGDHMEPMASLDLVQHLFGCRAKCDEQGQILVQSGDDQYSFHLGESSLWTKTEEIEISAPPESHDGTVYLPLKAVCELFDCGYTWDPETYEATMAEDYVMGELPKRFDLRTLNGVAEVRDQGSAATCWAQAAITALESSLLPSRSFYFDVDHMTTENNFNIDVSLGGEYSMAVAYLLSWTGPVDTETGQVAGHLQEVHFFDQDDLDDIKWAVYQTGGVSTSIYANASNSNLSKSTYYNRRTNAYAYLGEQEPNHDVVIIGWDDSYSADHFSVDVPGDGAFICQNSWGKDFGDDGVFYVSYYDTNIGDQSVSYVKFEDTDNYDRIYQSDLCGWIGQVGYNKEKITAANVYTAEDNEKICSAGFYALGKNTSYHVYIVENFEDTASLANRVEVASGQLDYEGYYTIEFNRSVTVSKGQRFAIVVALTTPGVLHPMAIEYHASDLNANVDITDGEGYISNNGLDWERVEDMAEGNLCLKAYSKQIREEP